MTGTAPIWEIDGQLSRQHGYFDTKFLNDKECAQLRQFGRVIPGFDVMKNLTTICKLRILTRRRKRALAKKTRALQLIVAISPKRRVSAAAAIAKEAIAQD